MSAVANIFTPMQSTNQGSVISVRTSDASYKTVSSGGWHIHSAAQQSMVYHHDYNRANTWNHITLPVSSPTGKTTSFTSIHQEVAQELSNQQWTAEITSGPRRARGEQQEGDATGEDALFTSSGVENESYVTTPLNMYTVAEQVPMMADVRQGISDIPLAILAADKARAEHMQLAFYLSSNWTRECYFCDSKTGQKIRIMDGLVITVEMPQNHEQRYYIEGPDEYLGSSEDPQGPTTAVDNTSSSALATLQAFSLAQGELTIGSNQLIQEIRLYDLAGRLILDNSLTLLHTTTTVTAPSGICLVEAVLRDGTTLHTQALVK